jgi:parallel beta-helix repeat protein
MMSAKLRIVGIHLLILCAVAGAGAALSLRFARVPVQWQLRSYPHLAVRPNEAAVNPVLAAVQGMPPDSDMRRERRPSPRIHAIMVSPHAITLRAGGRIVRSISIARPALELTQIVRAVADPSWISHAAPGVVDLRAALIMGPGTSLTVAAPSVRVLRLTDRPGTMLAADRAALVIRSATVTSPHMRYIDSPGVQDTDSPGVQDTDRYRPFILAESGSRMWITDSRLAGLGWNGDDSYGVSWETGSTGGATGSTFTGNYFGIYTSRVAGLVFTDDVVTGSYSYGIDPHSHSSRLTITKNTVTGNGRHGIILADHVTGSTVEGNTVRGNAANGIMMYQGSSGNLIEGNTVTGNHGDGVVLTASPRNRLIRNVIQGNRVGLHLARTPSGMVTLSGNLVAGNALNSQGILSAAGNVVASDTHLGWNADWLAVIWVLGTVMVTVTLMSLTSCLLSGRQVR